MGFKSAHSSLFIPVCVIFVFMEVMPTMKENFLDRFYARLDGLGEKLQTKEFRIPVNITAGVVFFLFALFILAVMPQQVPISEGDAINGRSFPTLLMAVMMLCCAGLVLKDVYKIITKKPIEWKVINLNTEVKALVIFIILLISFFLCIVTDLFVVGSIFCCLGFLIYFRCKKPSYYAITLGIAVIIWVAFRFGLGVEF